MINDHICNKKIRDIPQPLLEKIIVQSGNDNCSQTSLLWNKIFRSTRRVLVLTDEVHLPPNCFDRFHNICKIRFDQINENQLTSILEFQMLGNILIGLSSDKELTHHDLKKKFGEFKLQPTICGIPIRTFHSETDKSKYILQRFLFGIPFDWNEDLMIRGKIIKEIELDRQNS